jgi:hypothetical protein
VSALEHLLPSKVAEYGSGIHLRCRRGGGSTLIRNSHGIFKSPRSSSKKTPRRNMRKPISSSSFGDGKAAARGHLSHKPILFSRGPIGRRHHLQNRPSDFPEANLEGWAAAETSDLGSKDGMFLP